MEDNHTRETDSKSLETGETVTLKANSGKSALPLSRPELSSFEQEIKWNLDRIRNLPVKFYRKETITMEEHAIYMETEVKNAYEKMRAHIEEYLKETINSIRNLDLYDGDCEVTPSEQEYALGILDMFENELARLKEVIHGK